MNIPVLSAVTVGLYLGTGTLLGWRLARRPEQKKQGILALGLVAALLHGFLLYDGVYTGLGRDLGFFNVASLVAWMMALLVLFGALRMPVENIAIVILPLAAISVVLAISFPTPHLLQGSPSLERFAHILSSVLAYSILTIAALQAILLAVQHHHLRHRQPGGFIRALPPLQTMETLLFQMIWAGFILLTLSLFSGVLFLEDIFAQHLVHKSVLSVVAWIVFAVLLWGRYRFGWRGRVAVRWTLWGFVVLAVAYFGSKMVLELILTR